MADTIKTIKRYLYNKSVVTLFIIINIAVFIAAHLLALVSGLTGTGFFTSHLIELPSSFYQLLLHPWTLVTYMFTHYDLLHILFNMMWMYCFGIVFLDYYSEKKFVRLYIFGGIAGAVMYLLANTLYFDYRSSGLIGASAAILALATTTIMRAPNYHINLFLIGQVKIKWIALIFIAFALLTTDTGNMFGHFAHLGGILAGIAYFFIERRNRTQRKFKIIVPNKSSHQSVEEQLDELLIKVKQSGYESLSKSEKQRLNELSKKL